MVQIFITVVKAFLRLAALELMPQFADFGVKVKQTMYRPGRHCGLQEVGNSRISGQSSH
jgi:hypothetical protein